MFRCGTQYRESDQVGANANVQIYRLHAKTNGHVRQGGGNYRTVDKLHKESSGNK